MVAGAGPGAGPLALVTGVVGAGGVGMRVAPYLAAMSDRDPRPLLFLDVDGTLLPFGAGARRATAGPVAASVDAVAGNPLLARLDLRLGPLLSGLPCDLVWATTWMGEANDVLCPLLGLPTLPVITWPDEDEDEGDGRVHWKTRGLVSWAAGRPFVWLDDEVTDVDRRWVRQNHHADVLLHQVTPSTGLTNADLAVVTAWLTHASR